MSLPARLRHTSRTPFFRSDPCHRRPGGYAARHVAEPVCKEGMATTSKAVGVPVLMAAVVTAGAPGWTTYLVRPGDTLTGIAKREHTSVARLASANGLAGQEHHIVAGRTLKVPAHQAPTTEKRDLVHAVSSGDTLWALARTYHTSIRSLMQANGLTSTVLRPGQRLKVGTTTVAQASTATRVSGRAVVHTVTSGDTLWSVAQRYHTTIADLRTDNGLRTNVIFPGEQLRIGTATATTSPSRTLGNTSAPTYADATVRDAARNRALLAARNLPSRDAMKALIVRVARSNGVDPALALAVSWQEAGWQQDRVSVANAIGAMQVVPGTGTWISGLIGRQLDLLDPEDNVTAGVMLLRILLKQADSEADAVAGYYQGLAGVRRDGYHADTKVYVRNVQALKARFS